MADRLMLVAITGENFCNNEVEYISTILDSGFDYVHIRKPHASHNEIESMIKEIPKQYYSRLKINNHSSIAVKLNLAGFHENSISTPLLQKNEKMHVSRSCHSVAEIQVYSDLYEYLFLSPIYDSISKVGYSSAFDITTLKDKINNYSNIIALGGIDATKLLELKTIGFAGAAFLGYLFEAPTISELKNRIQLILRNA